MNTALKYANIVKEQESNAHSRSTVTSVKLNKEDTYIENDVAVNHKEDAETW